MEVAPPPKRGESGVGSRFKKLIECSDVVRIVPSALT